MDKSVSDKGGLARYLSPLQAWALSFGCAVGWDEYLAWQSEDRKTLRRIHQLLQSIDRNGYECIGRPEPLRHDLTGWWSVRINEADRLVFRIVEDHIEILSCKGHYD